MGVDKFQKLEEEFGQGRVKVDEPLSRHTTFQIGGPADFYFEANTVEELIEAVKVAEELKIPYFILGGGSNLLASDKGFRGLVIKNKSSRIKILKVRGKIGMGMGGTKMDVKDVLVEADAGVPFNQLVRFTLEEGLAGLEEFLGLPGTVGGAVTVNAHWRDKRIQDFIVSKKFLNDDILLSAVFDLKKADKDLLWDKAQQVLEYRQKKHPTGASAGCIFKNIQKSEAVRIGTPNFTTSAGFLIEAAGLKGVKIANVQISPIHANFIVNLSTDPLRREASKTGLGGGKASDVLKLISLIKKKVKEKFKVDLKEEIVKMGEF